MGSEGGSKPGRIARLLKLMRVLLMTSGAAAVSWTALLTDAGDSVTHGLLRYGRAALQRLPDLLERLPRPSVDAAEGAAGAAPPPRENAPRSAPPAYRGPAWYEWQAAEQRQGDQMRELGPFNMIVQTPAGLGLTSSSVDPADVSFSFQPLEQISVSLRLRFPRWSGQRITLFAGRTELAAVQFSGSELVFGDDRENYRSAGCTGEQDEVTLSLADGSARLWCNGHFVGIQIVRRLALSQVRVTGLVRKRDYLYSLTARTGAE